MVEVQIIKLLIDYLAPYNRIYKPMNKLVYSHYATLLATVFNKGQLLWRNIKIMFKKIEKCYVP